MKTKRLMVDSGAYSVWTKGKKIILEDYISFCKEFPEASYYVNLDTIPGSFKSKEPLKQKDIETACQASWENYLVMIDSLPKEKVIPVVHQGEGRKWIKKYLDYGVKYLGVSPTQNVSILSRVNYLKSVESSLFDRTKQPLVKIHGFGVSSHELIKFWQWHSVDSSSWSMDAAWGLIYIPLKTKNVFDYSKSPFVLAVSPRSSLLNIRGKHLKNLSPGVKQTVMEYFDLCGVKEGKFRSFKVDKGYKLKEEEHWYDKKTNEVMIVEEAGVTPSQEERMKVNIRFIQQSNKVLPVDHIYFAGGCHDSVEYTLGRRLAAYPCFDSKSGRKILEEHTRLIRERNNQENAK